jgi:uncharacterized damage-inducible protein DinB
MEIHMTVRLLSISLLVAAAAAAEPLSQGERDRAMSHLHSTRKMLLDTVAPLSDAQWKFKPAPEVWSVAEVAEHLAASEELIFGRVRKMLEAPPEPDKKAEVKGKDEVVLKVIADRSRKAQAPEAIRPSGRYKTRAAVVEAFRNLRDRTIEFVQTTDGDLRSHFGPHPATGLLDTYQWILLISSHTDRHVQQMKEVIANPSFPKK